MHTTHELLHKSLAATPTLIGAGAYSAPRGRDFPPHHHTVWEIVYYREGAIGCPVGETLFLSQPGLILATRPGVTHAEQAWTAYANFHIQVDALPETPWPVASYDDADGTIGAVCRALVREAQRTTSDADEMAGLLLRQLDMLLRRTELPDVMPESERIVRAAEVLIGERYAGALRLAGVAAELGVAPATLRAYFAAARGYSPRDYLLKVRAERATGLLRTSDLTLEAVARLTGYDSASHLSRHIKAATGHSPGRLRRGSPPVTGPE